jgi:hypothetical protein
MFPRFARQRAGLWLPTDKPPLGSKLIADHPLAQGMVAGYLFNEGGGNTLYPVAGGPMQIDSPTAWQNTLNAPSLYFNSSSGGVDTPGINISYLQNLPAVSIHMIVIAYGQGQNGEGFLCAKFHGSLPYWYDGWCFFNNGNSSLSFGATFSSQQVQRITNMNVWSLNTWYSFSSTWDGSTNGSNIHLYINGTEQSYATTQNGIGSYSAEAQRFAIGWSPAYSAGWWNGNIALCYVWNRVLSPAEIAWINADPYAMFDPPMPVRTFYVSGGGNIWNVTCSDGPNFGDAPSAACAFGVSIIDGITSGESINPACTFIGTGSDGIVLAETISAQVSFKVTVSDGQNFGDSISGLATFQGSVTDGPTFAETNSVQANFQTTVVDGLTFAEAILAACAFAVGISDGMSLTDWVSTGNLYSLSITDGILVSESLSAAFTLIGTILDGIALAETATATATFNVNLVDGAQIGETIGAICQFAVSIFDAFGIADMTVQISGGGGSQPPVITFTAQGKTFQFVLKGALAGSFAANPKKFNFTLN